jgi:hypothetical protein
MRSCYYSPVKDLVERLNRDAALKGLDLSRFNHPLALSTDWTPLVGGGASFKTRNLHRPGPHRIEFRHSPAYLFFWGFFIVAAAVLLVLQFPGMPMRLRIESATLRALALLGPLLFIVCGSGALILQGHAVFDRSEGFFWSGRKKGGRMPACHCRFDSIAALQILREDISGVDDTTQRYSYELNLVLNNAQRLNVLDHGSLPDVRLAAAEVQKFLPTNPPIWDTTLLNS